MVAALRSLSRVRTRALILLTFILSAPTGSAAENEPSYGGKKLSEWVRASALSTNGVQIEECKAAIRHIGSNAVPFLLEWMQYEPSPWREKAADAVAASKSVTQLSPALANTIAGSEQTRLATASFAALTALHPEPVAVTNQLYQILTSPSASPALKLNCAQVLANVGRDQQITLPLLLAGLENSSGDTRAAAAHGIYDLAGTFRTIGMSSPSKQLVTPALVRTLNDTNAEAVRWTISTVSLLRVEPALVLPPLTNLLSHPDSEIRMSAGVAIRWLSNSGSAPTNQVPQTRILRHQGTGTGSRP